MSSLKGVRILVTGATGYIGSHVSRKLVQEGCEVHILLRPTSGKHLISDIEENIIEHLYDGSYQSIERAVRLSRPEIVFHLASFASIRYETKDVPNMLESNIVMSTFLVEAMTQHQVKKLVNTSSFSQHVNQELYHPNSLYAATKQAFEDILLYYTNASSLQSITLVLFDNYGPNDPRPKLMNLIDRSLREGTTLLMTPGEQYLDLLYIDDVVDAYLVAAEQLFSCTGKRRERYAVRSKSRIKLQRLVPLFAEIAGKPLRVKWGALEYRPGEIMIPWNKGEVLPQWSQKIPIEQGIAKMICENDENLNKKEVK
ncbi:NAD-dependent epimerase/dehydratase family protein [Halalkalibacter krulwichiae]|uniref:CDP-abequose synthase n=1 Tax=Halalkalibacter krulwichiae TaxID=199441 RepID=A0A1X9MAS3_9BACI|nr:NAD-dependent epimerase/dehydratase family protein [Halalkalibacter krulwichiae]ARK29744.1 CDP-abequose synthase [Halalkalibacter krulwichiae]